MNSLLLSLREALARRGEANALARRFPNVEFEQHVVIKGDRANLRLGSDIRIQSGTVLHLGGMAWCEFLGSLEIGDGSTVSPNCVIYGAGSGGVHIGRNFDCGAGVGIFSSRTDYRSRRAQALFAPVNIGDDVIVFANAVISPGVSIGAGAVVAACSVVTRDVPDNCFVGGCPARIIERDVRG